MREPGRIVLAGEEAAEGGVDAEQRQSAISDVEAADMLGLSRAGDVEGIAVVDADVLECGVLLAINEIERGDHIQLGKIDAGGGVPDADQLLRMGIGKGLEQDAIDDAEDDGVGADADGQGEEGDGREHGSAAKPAHNLPELIDEDCHARYLVDFVQVRGAESAGFNALSYAIGKRLVQKRGSERDC